MTRILTAMMDLLFCYHNVVMLTFVTLIPRTRRFIIMCSELGDSKWVGLQHIPKAPWIYADFSSVEVNIRINSTVLWVGEGRTFRLYILLIYSVSKNKPRSKLKRRLCSSYKLS
jgi:hypothetical protein